MLFNVFYCIHTNRKTIKGPIAEDTSTKICTILLRKMNIPLNVVIVGPNYLKNKFNVITIDQFNLSFVNCFFNHTLTDISETDERFS